MHTDKLSDISEYLGLPKDAVFDLPVINIIGFGEITVDNFKNIKEFSDKQITLNTKDNSVILSGTSLEITHLTKETVTVKGNIKKLEFG